MKKIGFLFLISFLFFFLGQLLWTIGLIVDQPLFGSNSVEDWVLNIFFTLCSVFGLIASFKLYKKK
tara:strand:- start:170 stop:367 length:198 start_codon:yes stop_codon:yes gene_type:complete